MPNFAESVELDPGLVCINRKGPWATMPNFGESHGNRFQRLEEDKREGAFGQQRRFFVASYGNRFQRLEEDKR